jgi:hypothetical protein
MTKGNIMLVHIYPTSVYPAVRYPEQLPARYPEQLPR